MNAQLYQKIHDGSVGFRDAAVVCVEFVMAQQQKA